MGLPTYATAEQVMFAGDIKHSAYELAAVKRLVASASRKIDERLHRHFYPITETHVYQLASGGGFWLDADLLELIGITADGAVIDISTITLSPGTPPYSWISASGSDVDISGVWGYTDDTTPAGILESAIADAVSPTVDITDASLVGIGDLIIVGTERMIVEAKTMLDTGQNQLVDLAADLSAVQLTVASGAALHVGEVILVEAERMLIVDIAGNVAIVKRAWDGTVLAAHAQPQDVYAPRRLTVERGALGSTAAAHADASPVTRNVPPSVITDLCIAEAVTGREQEASGFARVVGSGENMREARGAGLDDLRKDAMRLRRNRLTAIR